MSDQAERQETDRAKQIGRIVQEEITALLEEHGWKHNGGHKTAEVVANMVQMAIDERVDALQKRVQELLDAVRGNWRCQPESGCAECEIIQPLIAKVEAALKGEKR